MMVLLPLMSACSHQADDTIRFGLSRLPVTLDPRFATDAASSRINRLLYQQLVDFDEAYQPVPALATWQPLSKTHYRFTLRTGRAAFSNGQPLTAADVKATYDYILESAHASPHRGSLTNIERIDSPDADTVDFYLTKPDALFPGRLIIGIVPQALIVAGHELNRLPVGSGEFVLDHWQGDSSLRLSRLSDQQAVEFVAVPDPTVRVLKLMRGEIDMLQNDLPPELVTYLEQQHDVNVSRAAGANYAYLGFNMKDDIVGQHAIREAIAHALDREAIIHYVLGDAARPASALLPPNHWAGDPALANIEYNPHKARELLAARGYDQSNPVSIVYKTSSDPFRLRLATIIQQQLKEVGIDVELRSYDWGTFYGDIKSGRFQMYSLMWVGVKLPDIFRYVFHSSAIPPNGANRGRFVDDITDQLIETAEAGDNLQQQAGYYRQLQAHLYEQLPYVPLWYEDHVFISRSNIVGYDIAADGNYDGLKQVRREDHTKVAKAEVF